MKNRILTAIKIGWWAFKNPAAINPHNMRLISDLMELIFKSARESLPVMTRIACIHPTLGQQNLVSLWAGPSMKADPYERITELKQEIESLKYQLLIEVKKNESILSEAK